jgi:glyoxylate reductase
LKPKCVVGLGLPSDLLAALQERYEVMHWSERFAMPDATLRECLADARGLLCALSTPITAPVIESARQLSVISTISVGVDHIDLTAATRAGIPVGHTPGVLVDSTADLALGLMLAVTRRLAEADRWMRDANWAQGWQSDLLLGTDLSRATVGVVGLGPIGEAVIRRLAGFGCKLVAWNRTPKSIDGVQMVELDEVFATSDIVTLHTALTAETTHIASRARLASMRSGAALINTGRGLLVDEQALTEEVCAGRLLAGLDVFSEEPLPADHPLLQKDNAVLLPHVGSATVATRMAMVERALENLHTGMLGERLPYCANPEVYGASADAR